MQKLQYLFQSKEVEDYKNAFYFNIFHSFE